MRLPTPLVLFALCAPLALSILAAPATAEPTTYELDAAASRLEVQTGTAGVFGGLAHAHTMVAPRFQGTVVYDPDDPGSASVTLVIDATAIFVATEGADEDDREAIHRGMHEDVLRTATHPEIRFTSSRVAALTGGLRLTGWLEITGRSVQVSFNVALRLEGDRLEARGSFKVKQTDFGIEPVSIGLGTIKVADEVRFRFRALGSAEPSGAGSGGAGPGDKR